MHNFVVYYKTSETNVNFVITLSPNELKFCVRHVGPHANISLSSFLLFDDVENYVILWRHFDVLTSMWRHNGCHISERPYLDEQNGVGFMSLSYLEPKLWPKMWFWPFWWPWSWPLTYTPVNFTNYSNCLYRSVQKV